MRKLICLLVLLIPLAAHVDAQERRFELTPYGGYRFNGDFDFDVSDDFFNNDLEVDEGFAYGLFFDIPLSRTFQLEILANRQEDGLNENGGLFHGDDRIADIEITHVHIGVLAQFGSGQVQPFVSATAGIARLDINLPGLNSDDRFAASLGGGVKIFVNDNFGFRLEGRSYYVDLDEDDDFDDRYRDQDSLTQAEASFGLIFAF